MVLSIIENRRLANRQGRAAETVGQSILRHGGMTEAITDIGDIKLSCGQGT